MIRKEIPLEEEVPFDIPDGWSWVSLGQLAHFLNGDRGKNYPSKANRVAEGVPFINAGHLKNGNIDFNKMDYITGERYDLLNGGKVQPKDILYCIRGSLGKSAVVSGISRAAIASSLLIIRVEENSCLQHYMWRYLMSPLGHSMIRMYDNGSAQPNLAAADVAKYSIPLPPLAEQHRIVEKIEALLADANAACERLAKVPRILKRFRQAVLAAACSGRLTEEWREECDGKECDGNELPTNWIWATPDELAESTPNALTIGPFGSDLKVSDYQMSGVPLVFVRDIRAETFRGSKRRFISREKARALSSHTVRPGDLLITKMGEPPGDTAVYPMGHDEAIITADCIKLTPRKKITTSSFLRYCFRAEPVRSQIIEQTMGVAQQKLSLARFRQVKIPLPPLAEQTEIVRRVEALFSLADTIEQRVTAAAARADRVPQAILSKAFKGELVPTEVELARAEGRGYESAAELLARVKAARESEGAGGSGGKKGKTALGRGRKRTR
jgi:type I restriction enzyme S subunit